MNNGSIVINTVYSFQINEIVNKQSNKEKQQEYEQKPEVKARKKKYAQRSEVKARRKEYKKIRQQLKISKKRKSKENCNLIMFLVQNKILI